MTCLLLLSHSFLTGSTPLGLFKVDTVHTYIQYVYITQLYLITAKNKMEHQLALGNYVPSTINLITGHTSLSVKWYLYSTALPHLGPTACLLTASLYDAFLYLSPVGVEELGKENAMKWKCSRKNRRGVKDGGHVRWIRGDRASN